MSNNKFLSVFYTKLSSSAPQTTKQPSSSEKKLFKTWHGNTPTSQYYCFYCTLRKHVVCFLTFPSEGLWASWDFKKVKFSVFVYKYMLFFFFLWICGNPMDLWGSVSVYQYMFIDTCCFLVGLWWPNVSLKVCVCLSIHVYRYMLFSCGSVVTQYVSEGLCLFINTCLSIHAVFLWVCGDPICLWGSVSVYQYMSIDTCCFLVGQHPMCLWGLKSAKETFSCIWFYGMK